MDEILVADSEVQSVMLDDSLVVISKDGLETHYVPFSVHDGKVVMKRVDSAPIKPQAAAKPTGLPQHRRPLVIDPETIIRPRDFKRQLTYTDDIIGHRDVAPCTKQQIRHIVTGITKLFAHPAHRMPNATLLRLYTTNCTTRDQPNCETNTDFELPPLTPDKPIAPKIEGDHDLYAIKDNYVVLEELDDPAAPNNIEVLLAAAVTNENYIIIKSEPDYIVQDGL